MSDPIQPAIPGDANAPPAPLVVNLQYVKDLSFEVPGAPEVVTQLREQPRIDIGLDVQARPLQQDGNTFEVSLQTTLDMRQAVPRDRLLVTESGIVGPADVTAMRQAGVNAFLVGEAFMRVEEPGEGLRQLFFSA